MTLKFHDAYYYTNYYYYNNIVQFKKQQYKNNSRFPSQKTKKPFLMMKVKLTWYNYYY